MVFKQKLKSGVMKKNILSWVILWRFVLSIVAIIAIGILPYEPSFPYSEAILDPLGSRWLTAWANFDGVHYLTIIENGYVGTGSIQAFFPLFPLLVSFFNPLVGNPILTGVLISTVSFWAALLVLYKLLLLDENNKTSVKTIILIMLAPAAFFFTSFYTESLFLLFIALSFYKARKGRFLQAGIYGALAAATRAVGVFMFPALLVELWLQKKKRMFDYKNWLKVLASSLPLAGIGSYMYYLKRVFGDGLLFLHVQPQFGVQREVDKIILLYQVFWRYAKMVATVTRASLLYYNVWLELTIAVVFLGLLVWAFYKTRKSYALFALLAFLAPTVTGTFTSLPRYTLVLFPAYVLMAKYLSKKSYYLVLIISGILLVINTMLFIQGYWVA